MICGEVEAAVLVDGVLSVRLSEVVVAVPFETDDELCETVTVAFCWLFPVLLSNFELIIGGCDLTGMLCTVKRVGAAIERVDLTGVLEALSSRSGTI